MVYGTLNTYVIQYMIAITGDGASYKTPNIYSSDKQYVYLMSDCRTFLKQHAIGHILVVGTDVFSGYAVCIGVYMRVYTHTCTVHVYIHVCDLYVYVQFTLSLLLTPFRINGQNIHWCHVMNLFEEKLASGQGLHLLHKLTREHIYLGVSLTHECQPCSPGKEKSAL